MIEELLGDVFSIINVGGLLAASIIAVAGKSFTDYVKAPIKKRGYDTWWAVYVPLLFGLILVLVGGINMFNGEYLDGVVGLILTGLFAGGVSVGIYDVSKKINPGVKEE